MDLLFLLIVLLITEQTDSSLLMKDSPNCCLASWAGRLRNFPSLPYQLKDMMENKAPASPPFCAFILRLMGVRFTTSPSWSSLLEAMISLLASLLWSTLRFHQMWLKRHSTGHLIT